MTEPLSTKRATPTFLRVLDIIASAVLYGLVSWAIWHFFAKTTPGLVAVVVGLTGGMAYAFGRLRG